MARNILLINGPNLNLLGIREPHIYGCTSLADIETRAQTQCRTLSIQLSTYQSNHEGEIIDRIHNAREDGVEAIIINPGGLTHTSISLRDALSGVSIPFVEIHVTNTHAREAWRHHSYLSEKAVAVIIGMGVFGYSAAIEFLAKGFTEKKPREAENGTQ
ncbi:hypothetical protein EYZ11_011007 [Aspergillus tanneri]|uniref:Catabolic 3-dehydroquinase n=1 Tax=Aspergillus tanneri TaxID=1220188 RepID=A0A4S3J3Y4_9EURO|nr:Catabolic 3-dehydroquinase 2 [Aspergillus tanneri]KAA8646699.1 Catabolic 3-dehydroquinase 2 [Aspergillus tanneri]THC89540.1 hypothetical protein EYZ11_011007 [Aspergillus tanneri]